MARVVKRKRKGKQPTVPSMPSDPNGLLPWERRYLTWLSVKNYSAATVQVHDIVGLAVAGYAVVELGFLRRARVARDAEFELHLPIPQLIPTMPQKVSPAPNPDEEPDRVDDPTPPIPPDLDDPDGRRNIWYHYTNQINYEAIEQSRTIRANAAGRVYLTKSTLNEFDAFYALFMGQDDYKGKGSHVVILTLRDGIYLTKGTQQNEWIHRGSLKEPNDMTILWMGANPF